MSQPVESGRVRWMIVTLLVGFSLVSYIERMNISVAAQFMMPELGLTQVQMGRVFSAFVLGYALLQIPIGMLGDRIGPARILGWLGWLWAVLTVLTGYLPGIWGAAAALPVLIAIRFTLGLSIAGVYPLCARTVANWMPVSERAFAYSLVIAGVSLGSSITPPVVAWVMSTFGWRPSFYVAAIPALVIALLWRRYGADGPRTHPGISPGERQHILTGQSVEVTVPATAQTWLAMLRTRSLLLLGASYFFVGYVLYVFIFWFYTYLVEVRGFGLIGSGFFTSLPFVVAAILSPVGGAVCDGLTRRYGARLGRRITAMAGIALAALCLAVGINAEGAYLAVAALSLAFGFQMLAESAFWSAAMDIAGPATGAATGLINTLNNLGGVVSTALIPILIASFGWTVALGSCVAVSAVAALLWLGIDAGAALRTSPAPLAGAPSPVA